MTVSAAASTVGPANGTGTVWVPRATIRLRSRAGSTRSSFASAWTDTSSIPSSDTDRGRAQPDGDGHRLLVVEQQRRQ